ncbi:MAG: IS5 family transposase [bacterium]
MSRTVYSSDISREQFEAIRPQIECFRRRTKPRQHDYYELFGGMLYVLKTGCQWSALPSDYPPYHSVYTYFRQWSAKPFEDQPSLLEQLQHTLVEGERQADNRKKTSLIIMDSQSVKNSDTAGVKGYDGGKKVSGIKRHIAVDTNGLLHAIAITAANVGDREGGLLALSSQPESLSEVRKVLVDGGYTGEAFAKRVDDQLLEAEVEVVKRNELHTFKVLPKRWIVERSFAWLEKCRRLWKNCERLLNNSLQMVHLAFLSLLLKRL